MNSPWIFNFSFWGESVNRNSIIMISKRYQYVINMGNHYVINLGIVNFPHNCQITRFIKKFKDTGKLIKSTKKGQKWTSGRKLTSRSPENVDAVRDSVGWSPKNVTPEKLSKVGSFLFISSQNLEEWPSVVPIQNPDQTNSHTKWHDKTSWDVPVVQKQDPDFLQNVWFSDEAHFSLTGHVNSKNSVFWESQAPDEVLPRPLHSVKCTV